MCVCSSVAPSAPKNVYAKMKILSLLSPIRRNRGNGNRVCVCVCAAHAGMNDIILCSTYKLSCGIAICVHI